MPSDVCLFADFPVFVKTEGSPSLKLSLKRNLSRKWRSRVTFALHGRAFGASTVRFELLTSPNRPALFEILSLHIFRRQG